MGQDPSHLDSHQHRHNEEPLRSVLDAVGAEIGAPVRGRGSVHYDGRFYGQDGRGNPYPDAISPTALAALISSLPVGTTELGCHPGVAERMASMYAAERATELVTLTDPRVWAAVKRAGVQLIGFTTTAL
jgi:predicted glycoside hydrolase/deacetylase ChbG (UPF0249 family)